MLTMSPLTRYLSRLLGVFLLVTAVSEWTQPALLTVVFPGLFDQPGLLWCSACSPSRPGWRSCWVTMTGVIIRRRLCRSLGG